MTKETKAILLNMPVEMHVAVKKAAEIKDETVSSYIRKLLKANLRNMGLIE